MPLSITILTEGSLTASVVGQGIVASIVPSQALLEVNVGVPGASGTVSVGTTTTGDAGTDASVVNVGTTTNAILDFTIPRGDKGEQGNAGSNGTSATVSVGTTTTLSAGSSATVTNSGSTSAAVFNFGIPQGIQGLKGDKGDTGNTGAGVAPFGSAGQVLAKIDGTNYNTHWIDVSSGGGTWGSITGTLSNQTDLQTALDGKLSLTGGTMSGDIAFSVDGNGNDLLIGSWGLGVENIDGHTLYLQPDVLRIYDSSHLIGTSITGAGISFNDETIQTTAGLPLTGGQVTGNVTFKYTDQNPEPGYTNSIEINPEQFQISFQSPNYNSEFSPAGISLNQGATNLSFGFYYNGIRFTDGTIQQTAALPLTGGTMTENSNITVSTPINEYEYVYESIFNGDGLTVNYVNSSDPEYKTIHTTYGAREIIAHWEDNPAYGFVLNTGSVSGIENGVSWGIGVNGVTYPDTSVQTTAGLPLAGGIMSGAIRFDSVGTQNIAKGSFDSGRGGYNGISLNCAVDYELNWQAGYLKALNSGGFNVPINVESDIVNSTIPDIDNQGTKSTFNNNGLRAVFYNAGGAEETSVTTYGTGGIDNSVFDSPFNFHLNQNGVYGTGDGVDGVANWGIGLSGVTYPDSSTQVTAFPGYAGTTSDYIRGDGSTSPFPSIPVFPPSGGTTSQFIDGTGALQTYGPLGDRYFTTSNSTLTCDSGNGKTMTIGTGLSYSRQQDITVSYDNANHMHGTVLTYNSATGVMTFDSNTHSGGGTYSSWEVNVGGVAGAVLPVGGTVSQVLAKVNSTNFNTEWISLGSMATQPASAYLSTASAVANYLTISSAASTYQTQSGMSAYLSTASAVANYQTISGMSAYLSTSAAASTYQTQSGMSAYLSTASASANFIGTSAYATTAQAQAGTSTTTVVSPATLLDAKFFAGGKFLTTGITYVVATSGTGASSGGNGLNARVATAPTSATGYAQSHGAILNNVRGGAYNAAIDWSKRVVFGGRFTRNTITPDTNSVFRYTLGRVVAQTPSDILNTDKQVGIKVSGGGVIQLMCANGTTLSTVNSSFTPTNNSAYDVVITSDGAGNVVLYVNGSSVATSTGGPTSAQSGVYDTISFEVQNTSTLSNGAMVMFMTDTFAQINI